MNSHLDLSKAWAADRRHLALLRDAPSRTQVRLAIRRERHTVTVAPAPDRRRLSRGGSADDAACPCRQIHAGRGATRGLRRIASTGRLLPCPVISEDVVEQYQETVSAVQDHPDAVGAPADLA